MSNDELQTAAANLIALWDEYDAASSSVEQDAILARMEQAEDALRDATR